MKWLGWTRERGQRHDLPEPAMKRLGLDGLPRGRLIAVAGADPERRQRRLWRWACHVHRQGGAVLWLDPLAMCRDRLDEENEEFPKLSPRSHDAADQLLQQSMATGGFHLIILENFDALRPEGALEESVVKRPLKWRDETRYLAHWAGRCWRYQCTLVIGRRGYEQRRDPVDDHAVIRFEVNPTRGALQLVESRPLLEELGWRRLPGDSP